ncbi:ejaculatory bulb-specific protein 3-like [Ostrinia nubilalis]|uniref:ejaculatory bulb-specific protein 3-like n=1 Tax=Ostrinia nubilalis TaxID=29057 RepID=UPI0030826B10
MKVVAFIPIFTYLLLGANAEESPTYTTKYDGVNLDEILENDRLLTSYVNCLLETGPCTPDGKELKNNLPDAIQNDCKKCSERQREGADQVMEYIIDHRPDDWEKLEKKYNSDGSYKKKYLERKEARNQSNSAEKSQENDSKSKE